MSEITNKPDLSHLPGKPGVYLHKNSSGEIIYVGKAINLKQRVNQYWQKSSHAASSKTAVLASESVKVDYIETLSEIDALFLESELVKRYMPKFNVELRDDKSAIYVRIPYKDAVPAVSFTRVPKGDSATYVGPFYSAGPVYQAMRTLRRALPYSTHTKLPKKPCLHYQMGLCPGPEVEGFDTKKYKSNLKKLEKVLRGERATLINSIKKEMLTSADKQDFERAARLRNQLRGLERVGKIQLKDYDIIGADEALTGLQKLLGLKDSPKHIEGFDISHMSGQNVVASQVVFKNGVSSKVDYRNYKITNQQNNDFESMEDVISRRLKEKNIASWGLPDVLLIDGGKGQLQSARAAAKSQNIQIPMFGLAKQFEQIIVAKDDSNIEIDHKYAVKTGRIVVSEGDFWVISLNKKDTVRLLVERIRNEAHRFAVRYHTKLKGSAMTSTELSKIPGIGPQTARNLLLTFGSVNGVKETSQQHLASVVGNIKAKAIKAYFDKS